jgi:hypothetical protein
MTPELLMFEEAFDEVAEDPGYPETRSSSLGWNWIPLSQSMLFHPAIAQVSITIAERLQKRLSYGILKLQVGNEDAQGKLANL